MLQVWKMTRTLRLARPGRLIPWLGPALRGLVARRFKSNVCRHSPMQQATTWKYCKGCPHVQTCPYGLLLEPEAPATTEVFHGQEDVVRPFVLSPHYPITGKRRQGCEVYVNDGVEIPVQATFLGPHAIGQASYFWEAVRDAGADSGKGLGPDRISYELLPAPPEMEAATSWSVIDLPRHPDVVDETASWVRVRLNTPLFLHTRDDNGRRRGLVEPTFADLLRAALRTLGGLFAVYYEPLAADFAALKAASLSVPLVEDRFQRFEQPKNSRRSGSRMLYGVAGEGVFADVPGGLVHWLMWAGRVHVGSERVAGAGSWTVGWAHGETPPEKEAAWEWLD